MLTLLFSLLLFGADSTQYQSGNIDNIIESGITVPAACFGKVQFCSKD